MTRIGPRRGAARGFGWLVAALTATGLWAASAGAATIVSDSTFADADWSFSQFTSGNGGSAVAGQVSQSGNFLRSVADTVNAAAPATVSTIYNASIYTPFTYTPTVSGAIATIDYAENSICLSGCFGDGHSTGPAILQNGKVYISTAFLVTGPSTTFHPSTLTGQTAADFSLLAPSSAGCCDLTQHPDFSASAAPLQFGFWRGNGTSVGGGGYTLTAGIDDWQIAINNAGTVAFTSPVPTLDGWRLALLAVLIGVVAVAMRRRLR